MKIIKLLGNRVLLKPLPKPDRSAGGIMIPEQFKPEQQLHEVLAVGQGRRLKDGSYVPIELVTGEKILLDQYAIQGRTDAGDDTWIVNADVCSLAYI